MNIKLLLFFIILAFSKLSFAQNFPVTVVPQAVSPSPIYFSSYTDLNTSSSPLRVQILLNDITISNLQVRLKTYFEGNGINFQSNDVVIGAEALFLEGGVPLRLTNVELAPYFSLQNITGINGNQYAAAIPEGSYNFCFEVYDVFTGNRLSSKSCATTYIFKNEPPFLVLPRKNEIINVTNPQNIVFQWTPRHINVSNVEYELSIVEIWDNYVDPQAAFFSMPPIFQTTTKNTSYLLGPSDPMLLPNKKYAWRVQAKALVGLEEIGLFNNNGYSEVFWFSHSQPCKPPENVNSEVKGTHQANISWDDFTTDIPEYKIRYREKASGAKEGAWFYSRSNTDWVTIWDLRPGTVYEYQVNRRCEIIESDYSPIKTFTTFLADDESGLYSCGLSPEMSVTNKEPLPELFVSDVFKAGDFPIKVLEVSGSNGRFTGKGYVSMPYLKNIKVAVEFTNVLVNTDKQLAEGMVITVYDATWSNMLDVDEVIETAGEIVENVDQILDEVFGESEKPDIKDTNSESGENNESPNTSNESDTNEVKKDGDSVSQGEDPKTTETTSGGGGGSETTTTPQTGGATSNGETSENQSETGEKLITIQHNGINYKHGDIIEIEYKNNLENQRFDLVNVEEDAKVSWSLHSNMNQVQATASVGDGSYTIFDVKENQNKALEAYWKTKNADSNSEFEKIRVQIKLIKEEFDFVELYAKPALFKKRLAKSGEILYLIDDSGLSESSKHKKIDYGIKINPKIEKDKIDPLDINWYYGVNDTDLAKDNGSTNISRNLHISDALINTKVEAGYKEVLEKEIDVKWLDSRKKVKNFTHKLANFLDFFKVVNEISDKVGKVMPCSAIFFKNFDKNTKFQWTDYNQEDKDSRHVLDVKRFELVMEAGNMVKLKCGKELSLPIFGYNISLGEIYAQLTAGLSVSILNDDIYYSEDNRFKETQTFSSGGINIKGEVGLKVGGGVKDDEGNLLIGIEGGGIVEITGGGGIEYPYKGNSDEISGRLYLNPLMYTFKGSVKMGPLDHEFKYSDILLDVRAQNVIIYNMETGEFR